MIETSVLTIFIPTFFFVSVTPGMCMTLAMTMGMTIGVRKTFYMMWGELAGVALVSIASVSGVAALMLNFSIMLIFLIQLFINLLIMNMFVLVYLVIIPSIPKMIM